MSKELRIGEVIYDHRAKRDAIHIAVLPVTAGELLRPGQRVALTGEPPVAMVWRYPGGLGLVDPFLSRAIEAGERFWVFLHPGSISGLRHQWSHPAVPDEEVLTGHVPAQAAAERFLRQFADSWNMNFDDMISGATEGDGIVAQDIDIHSWMEIEDGGAAFWRNLEIYTGKKFSGKHREDTYFSCSC